MSETRRQVMLFNSPQETALRLLSLLVAGYPSVYDIQTLVIFDYLLVHSNDVEGPPSLHPATPHRSGEVLVRREGIRAGMNLLLRKGLAQYSSADNGVTFVASDISDQVLQSLTSSYAKLLLERAHWVGIDVLAPTEATEVAANV